SPASFTNIQTAALTVLTSNASEPQDPYSSERNHPLHQRASGCATTSALATVWRLRDAFSFAEAVSCSASAASPPANAPMLTARRPAGHSHGPRLGGRGVSARHCVPSLSP